MCQSTAAGVCQGRWRNLSPPSPSCPGRLVQGDAALAAALPWLSSPGQSPHSLGEQLPKYVSVYPCQCKESPFQPNCVALLPHIPPAAETWATSPRTAHGALRRDRPRMLHHQPESSGQLSQICVRFYNFLCLTSPCGVLFAALLP